MPYRHNSRCAFRRCVTERLKAHRSRYLTARLKACPDTSLSNGLLWLLTTGHLHLKKTGKAPNLPQGCSLLVWCLILRLVLLFMAVSHEAVLVLVHELRHLGFLIRSQDLEQRGMDARFLHDEVSHGLSLLRCHCPNLGFVDSAAVLKLL